MGRENKTLFLPAGHGLLLMFVPVYVTCLVGAWVPHNCGSVSFFRLRVFQQCWLLRIPVTNTSASPKCTSCPRVDGQQFGQRVLPWEWDEWPGGSQQHQLYHSSTWSCRDTSWQYSAQPTHRSVWCTPARCVSVLLVSPGKSAQFLFMERFSGGK